MTSHSLFSTMEFSLQSENYLDETFGLSADILAADLGSDGSILDFQFGHDGLKPEAGTQGSLEDLLLLDSPGDGFGDEWMENLDIRTLGDGNIDIVDTKQQEPCLNATVEPKLENEPRLEGMKVSAYELLKKLLTSNAAELQLQSNEAVQPISPASPEAEVPNLSLFDNIDTTNVDTFLDSSLEDQSYTENQEIPVIEIQPEISLDNGDVAEIKPVMVPHVVNLINLPDDSSVLSSLSSQSVNLFLSRPSTPDNSFSTQSDCSFLVSDVESLLSTTPSSPSDSSGFQTLDESQLDSNSQCAVDKSFQISDVEFTKLKSKTSRNTKEKRSSPYTVDTTVDKKDRKRVQNKNAATRYREKKRSEKNSLGDQEKQLSDRNKELREKVESLQREISYMKELMNEIQKAKMSKI